MERALGSLRAARILSIHGIRRTPLPQLERFILSAGYFRQKARRIKIFVSFLDERYAGSLTRMFAQPTATLREELLSLEGVGPETADSILLYAGNHPVFVVDAYTRRILDRHRLADPQASYEEIRELFERALGPVAETLLKPGSGPVLGEGPSGSSHAPSRMSIAQRDASAQVFNEMHGLIVGVGKHFCKKSQPACERCPLQKFLPGAE